MITRTHCLSRTEAARVGGVLPNEAREEINVGLFQQKKRVSVCISVLFISTRLAVAR